MSNKNLTYKLLEEHLVTGKMLPGNEISILPNHTLLHDSTGVLALLAFDSLKISSIQVEKAAIYIDHNILQVGCENANDHAFLSSSARKYGLYYFGPGTGICHQLHRENFGSPGQFLLGADSHTTTAGAMGMIGIGAGGLDVALALAGQPFNLILPKVTKIELKGELPTWSSAKDLALEILRRLTVSGGKGKVFEFSGEGVKTLTIPERATVANMSIETGAFTSIFPSDEITKDYLKTLNRIDDYRPLFADPNAVYDDEMIVDLGNIVPLVARPHSPDNVCPVQEIDGLAIDQVAIGTCTNSTFEDLFLASSILKGKKIHPGLDLIIVPGTRNVIRELIAIDALEPLISSGARILESSCGFCIGNGQAPRSGSVSVRTANRNFKGRCGTSDAKVFLSSVETAVASAITGYLTDPRKLGEPIKKQFNNRVIKTEYSLKEPKHDLSTKIILGPSIKPLPELYELPNCVEGTVLLSLGDNISTDDIMPVRGPVTNLKSNIPAMAEYVFSGIDPSFSDRVRKEDGAWIIAGENYGQGSSREQAALAPRFLGIIGIIAEGFARIHKDNLINFGILPLEFIDPSHRSLIHIDDRLIINNSIRAVRDDIEIVVENTSKNVIIKTKLNISPRQREILIAGGALNYAKALLSEIDLPPKN